jgi:hypothetical protein
MADFTPSIYPSGMTPYQPPNALQQVGQAVGIKNQLMQNQIAQQTLQQQQIQTKQAQDIQGAMGELQNYKNPQGGYDYNGWLSNSVATKYPLAVSTALDIRNRQIGSLVSGAYNEQGQPIVTTPEGVGLALGGGKSASQNGQPQQSGQQTNPFSNVPTASGGLPPDPSKQRDYFQDRQDAADAAQKDESAIKNVYDLVKKGAQPGTVIGSLNTWLAQHNIDVSGSTDAASALQLIKDHASQLAVNTGSRTDSDLLAKQIAGINPNDLNGSLKKMLPYLIGNREMAQDQAKYLQNKAPNAYDPSSIANARSFLQQRSDPRVYELRFLQQNDPAAFADRVKSLSSQDRKSLAHMDNELSAGQALQEPQQ